MRSHVHYRPKERVSFVVHILTEYSQVGGQDCGSQMVARTNYRLDFGDGKT